MKVKLWGARGSIPSPGPETIRYGGNTSCVSVTLVGRLDARPRRRHRHPQPRPRAGRRAGPRSTSCSPTCTSTTSRGSMFFAPAFRPQTEIVDLGPGLAGGLAARPHRPLHLGAALAGRGPRAALRRLLPRRARTIEWEIGPARIRAASVTHRGPTLGYRINDGDTSLAYIPDHEPALGADARRRSSADWISGFDLARDASLLIHDCQYTDAEYPDHVGWGHSRAHRRAHLRPPRRGRAPRCSSTTTRCTPTTSSTPSTAPRCRAGRRWAATRPASRWAWSAARSSWPPRRLPSNGLGPSDPAPAAPNFGITRRMNALVRWGSCAAFIAALLVGAPAASAVPIPEGPAAGSLPVYSGAPAAAEPVGASQPPRHPFMAPNERSNLHDDAYQTDAYRTLGPLGRDVLKQDTFLPNLGECASDHLRQPGPARHRVRIDRRSRRWPCSTRPASTCSPPTRCRRATPATLNSLFTYFGGGGYFYLDNQDRAVIPTTSHHILVVGETVRPRLRPRARLRRQRRRALGRLDPLGAARLVGPALVRVGQGLRGHRRPGHGRREVARHERVDRQLVRGRRDGRRVHRLRRRALPVRRGRRRHADGHLARAPTPTSGSTSPARRRRARARRRR